jgi:hypothetical protein
MKILSFNRLLKSNKSVLGYTIALIILSFCIPNPVKAEVSDQDKRFLILEAARIKCEDSNPELSEYSSWDTERRFMQGNWCVTLSSSNRIDRDSSQEEPVQSLFAMSSTSNGKQVYIHNYWSYGYIYDYASGGYEPSIFEAWSIKIVDLYIPETLTGAIQQSIDSVFGVHNRDVILLDAKITPFGRVIEYEVGDAYVFNNYLSDIREGLVIFNQYPLPLEASSFR